MDDRSEEFFLEQEEPQRSCLLALREIILAHDRQISASIKYGMPCFLFQNRALVYLWLDKKSKEPYILFVDGALMDDKCLEDGNRSRMKILRVDPGGDIDIDMINSLLSKAITLRIN